MACSVVLDRELNKHKKDRLFRQSRGYFMHLICGECGQAAICYSHSQTKIFCKGCSDLLLKPTGGFAQIAGNTKSKKADNIY